MSFGGSPTCPVCNKAVYHMEQVIGPGRKIFHKLCLKCKNCQKRLDQGSVVDHDAQPYCARCHVLLFGTRDLRHANVLPSTPARTPSKPSGGPSHSNSNVPSASASASTPLSPPRLPNRPVSTEFYTPPRLDQHSDVPRDTPTSTPDPSTPITRPDFRSSRPISVPYAGGSKALDERGLLKRGESPRSKVGEKMGGVGEDMCNGCGKRVYAAEQLVAIGHKWHRACLRCATCKSTLDPAKVSDREGQVYCKNCYAKNFGPGGIMGQR